MRSNSILLLAMVVLAGSSVCAEIQYDIIDLGLLDGYDGSRAWSINNNNQIVGAAFNGPPDYGNRAVLFDVTGGGNNIGLEFGGDASAALSINNSGQIVGGSDTPTSSDDWYPTTFDPTGDGNNIKSNTAGCSESINDSGQVVGFLGYHVSSDAVLFGSGYQNNIQLGGLNGYAYSAAHSINNNGQIVGYAFTNSNPYSPLNDVRATLFDSTGGGNNIDLGSLGGDRSFAVSINDDGQIVGRASTGSDEYWLDHAVLFDVNDASNNIDLGTPAGLDGSVATCINNKGQIVGQAWDFSFGFPGNFFAVLFDATGGGNNIDLNTLIDPAVEYHLYCAICVNDNGWIVGWGYNTDGDYRALLLIPKTANTEPVACIAGGDRVVPVGVDCEARVILDGSCSSDADSIGGTNNDIKYFDWYKMTPGYGDYLGEGEVIECDLPLGEYTIVLEVRDKAGEVDSNEVTITVEDTTPPEFSLSVSPELLWPPNHKMVEVTPSWVVSDLCDGSPEVRLISVVSNEPDNSKGDGNTNDDIEVSDDGTSIYLRAERSGKGNGRVYTITYEAVDASGNSTVESVTVTVPHEQR